MEKQILSCCAIHVGGGARISEGDKEDTVQTAIEITIISPIEVRKYEAV